VDAIGSGSDYSCALAGGKVWCWGQTANGQISNPAVAPVACGGNLCDPQPTPVQATGLDGGSTLVPDGGANQNPLTSITSLMVGRIFVCALDASGGIWCWGNSGTASIIGVATPFTSATVPFTGVRQITLSGNWVSNGLRYVTPSDYVVSNQAVTPYCQ
jgi:hypothetical protein